MSLLRVPVESGAAFSGGVLVQRVSARRSFDEASRSFGAQEIDEKTKLPIWSVEGYDIAAMKAAPVETKSGFTFKEPAEVRVFVASAEEPSIPVNEVNGFSGVAQFTGLTVTPWMSDKACAGLRHDDDGNKIRCGCRIKLSFRASGLVPFRG